MHIILINFTEDKIYAYKIMHKSISNVFSLKYVIKKIL